MTITIVPPTPLVPSSTPKAPMVPSSGWHPQDGTKGVGGTVVIGIGALGMDMTQTT